MDRPERERRRQPTPAKGTGNLQTGGLALPLFRYKRFEAKARQAPSLHLFRLYANRIIFI